MLVKSRRVSVEHGLMSCLFEIEKCCRGEMKIVITTRYFYFTLNRNKRL